MINKLETLVARIAQFNDAVIEMVDAYADVCATRADILDEAKALGIKRANAEAMLAKIKFQATMPESDPADEPELPLRETESPAAAEKMKGDTSQAAVAEDDPLAIPPGLDRRRNLPVEPYEDGA